MVDDERRRDGFFGVGEGKEATKFVGRFEVNHFEHFQAKLFDFGKHEPKRKVNAIILSFFLIFFPNYF